MDLQPIVNNPYFQLAGTLATFLGTLLAVYMLFKAKKSISYALTETRIFDRTEWSQLSEEVYLDSSLGHLDRLTRSHVVIFNEGSGTAHFREDVAEIRFYPGEKGRIIQAGVLSADNSHSAADILAFENSVQLRFDFLLGRDAIVFFVDHSGGGHSNVSVSSKHRGLGKSKFVDSEYWQKHHLYKYGPLALLLLSFAVALFFIGQSPYLHSILLGMPAALLLYASFRTVRRLHRGGALLLYMKRVRSIDDRESRNNNSVGTPPLKLLA